MNHFELFARKMGEAGLGENVIAAFQHNYEALVAEETGLIPEKNIEPIEELLQFDDLPEFDDADASQLLEQTVMLKLNGGLGTSMGLEKAKSLLPVRGDETFLDLIVKQLLHLRKSAGGDSAKPAFVLMNSFSTSEDTRDALECYGELGDFESIELLQNRIPKVDAGSLRPAEWPNCAELEWCPPGHGDIYTALSGTGMLEDLLDNGIRYAFVSNADNLGASLDLRILQHFARGGFPFMMEVCQRTSSDRKGGHLARNLGDGRLLLRESAQTPDEDLDAFQDIDRHRFFNTNNLWLRLDVLRETLEARGGWLPLPLIRNKKTLDPRDGDSPAVYQLETAMGAAIGCFDDSSALVVPRSRFAPVKTTGDLLAVRSDAYELTEDFRLQLVESREGQPPMITLSGRHYKLVDQLEAATPEGAPSLIDCSELSVEGPVVFPHGARFIGKVTITNTSNEPATLPEREFRDESYDCPQTE